MLGRGSAEGHDRSKDKTTVEDVSRSQTTVGVVARDMCRSVSKDVPIVRKE